MRKLVPIKNVVALFIDDWGRTYDQLGDPASAKRWRQGEKQRFEEHIRRCLRKPLDFLILDLTGFSWWQKWQVRRFLKDLAPADQARIKRVGF